MDTALLSPEARTEYAWSQFQRKWPQYAPTVGNEDQIEHYIKTHHLTHDLPSLDKAFIECCKLGIIITHRQVVAYMTGEQARRYLTNYDNQLPTGELPTEIK